MVIPIGGGGGGMGGMAPLVGPPPPELMPRFRKIRTCLIVMTISLLVKLVCIFGINDDVFSRVWSCFNPVLNALIGIYLLKDDVFFGKVHKCLVGTFCNSCADQCQGGMSCLCTWFVCNAITVLFALIPLPDNTSDMAVIIDGFNKLSTPSLWHSNLWVVLWTLFLASTVAALLAQIIGAFQGWKAMKEANEIAGPAAGGGDWGTGGGGYGDPYGGYPEARQQQRMQDPEAGGAGGGGRFSGGSGNPSGDVGRPAPGFQPFQGSGQRLGG